MSKVAIGSRKARTENLLFRSSKEVFLKMWKNIWWSGEDLR